MLVNCHTYYSLCYGTLSLEQLMAEVKQKGYSAFVLSDINNTSACLDAIRTAKDFAIKPILGIDFRNGVKQQYIAIAKNNEGFKEINEHLTQHLHSKIEIDTCAPGFKNAYLVYPLNT